MSALNNFLGVCMQKKLSFSDEDGYKIECLLDLNDVSALTKIKVGTLRKYIMRKTIPYIKVGAAVRFRVSEIDGWLKSNSFIPGV
jgi:excisionase family DNA binding protein